MRKIIFIAALVIAAGTSVVYANNDPEVNQKIKNAFSKQFSGATNIQWQNQDELSVAVFLLDGIRAAAYYDQEGILHATIRTIFYNQLPLIVMSAINNKYEDAIVVNVSEITNSNGTHYNIIVESGTKKRSMDVDASGTILTNKNIK